MLAEFGHKHPCDEFIVLEKTDAEPGDIIEFYLIPDRELTDRDAIDIAYKALEIKKDYPDAIIHYLRIDPHRVTVQFSTSPVGGQKYTWWIYVIYALIAILAIYVITWSVIEIAKVLRGVAPTGNVSVIAINAYDGAAIAAPFTFNGDAYTTPIEIEDVSVGPHHITWLLVEGYLLPDPPTDTVTIIADETVEACGDYWAEDAPPRPTTGLLIVATYPVRGTVYVDGADRGKAPLELTIEKGDHTVSFGDVSGYEAPQAREVTIHAGGRTTVIGEYKRIWPTWVWAVIGVAGAVGIAAIVTTVTKLVRRSKYLKK